MMDRATAEKLNEKYGSLRAAARATGICRTTLNRAMAKGVDAPVAEAPPVNIATFSLKGVALLSRRPQDTVKGKLFGLKRDVGYKIEDLAASWHMSVETLRKRAKEHKALAYVEATPGEYVACVVHPDSMKDVG